MHAAVRRSGLHATLAFALGSCASLGASTPPDTYEISAPTGTVRSAAATRAQLLIPEPTAIKTLDSSQIVIKPTSYTVEYLAKSQWSDRLPRMVQLRFVQAFENTGRVAAVGVPGQGLAIDYQVVMEIRRFEIDASGPRKAVVEIAVKALNDKTGAVRATRVFTNASAVAGTDNAGYVAALDQAFDATSTEVVAWMLRLV